MRTTPPVKVSLFNHKGGVSKTTTTFNIGWKLAEHGYKVVMVDADPQCNLTGMVLGYSAADDLENFYGVSNSTGTIKTGLTPAFEAQPREISAVPLVTVPEREGLSLLVGDLRLAEYETTLGIAQELSGAIQALQNLPGSLNFLIDRTAESVDADIVLIDMSPGLGPVNQNLVSISDYILVPTAPDFFSVMAIDSLSRVLPRWYDWASQAASLPVLRDAAYPFPSPKAKVLGTVVQKYRPRGGNPAASFQRWIDDVGAAVVETLRPALATRDMLLTDHQYQSAGVGADLCLAQIAEFNSLIAKSQRFRTPIFALTPAQLEGAGAVQENWIESRDAFNTLFEELARRVETLASLGTPGAGS